MVALCVGREALFLGRIAGKKSAMHPLPSSLQPRARDNAGWAHLAAAFGVGGRMPPHNERAKREVIPARNARATLTKHCSNQPSRNKHSNNTTSCNPARKLASLWTESGANLHAGYSRIREMRVNVWYAGRGMYAATLYAFTAQGKSAVRICNTHAHAAWTTRADTDCNPLCHMRAMCM